MGEDVPELNGHRPQTCTVVPRYSRTPVTREAEPPPRPPQPREPGTGSRTVAVFRALAGAWMAWALFFVGRNNMGAI
jgi:hypothetical protein